MQPSTIDTEDLIRISALPVVRRWRATVRRVHAAKATMRQAGESRACPALVDAVVQERTERPPALYAARKCLERLGKPPSIVFRFKLDALLRIPDPAEAIEPANDGESLTLALDLPATRGDCMGQKLLDLAKIRRDGETQMRLKTDLGTVDRYAEVLSDPESTTPVYDRLPPVVVYHDGKTFWLAEGYHRLAAAEKIGLEKFRAEIRKGGRREALQCACGANADHGLPRSLGDKLKAVGTAVKEWPEQSDEWIAKITRTRQSFVRKLRQEIESVANAAPEPDASYQATGPTAAQQLEGLSELDKVAAIKADEETDAERTKDCQKCGGSGVCPRCEGTGKVLY